MCQKKYLKGNLDLFKDVNEDLTSWYNFLHKDNFHGYLFIYLSIYLFLILCLLFIVEIVIVNFYNEFGQYVPAARVLVMTSQASSRADNDLLGPSFCTERREYRH